jgi:hypothetical protein
MTVSAGVPCAPHALSTRGANELASGELELATAASPGLPQRQKPIGEETPCRGNSCSDGIGPEEPTTTSSRTAKGITCEVAAKMTRMRGTCGRGHETTKANATSMVTFTVGAAAGASPSPLVSATRNETLRPASALSGPITLTTPETGSRAKGAAAAAPPGSENTRESGARALLDAPESVVTTLPTGVVEGTLDISSAAAPLSSTAAAAAPVHIGAVTRSMTPARAREQHTGRGVEQSSNAITPETALAKAQRPGLLAVPTPLDPPAGAIFHRARSCASTAA